MIRDTAMMDLYNDDVESLDLPNSRKNTFRKALNKFVNVYYKVADFFYKNDLPVPEMPRYFGLFEQKKSSLKIELDTGKELRYYELPIPQELWGYYNTDSTKTATNELIESGEEVSRLQYGLSKVNEMLGYNVSRKGKKILGVLKEVYESSIEHAKDPQNTYKTLTHELFHHFLEKIKNPRTRKSWNDSLETVEAVEGTTVVGTDAALKLKTTRKGELYDMYKQKAAKALEKYGDFVRAVKRFVRGDSSPVYAVNQEFAGEYR